MIQTTRQATEAAGPAEGFPTIWNLRADDLHEAYWRGHGVQCIRRGEPAAFQDGADLFLLIEPDQLVVFDVPALADRLAWRAARLTRLRVVDHHDSSYGEHIEVDEAGFVKSVGRRYRHRRQSAYRVLITTNRRFARMWMQAERRRDGWRRISRSAGLANVDHWHCKGGCFTRDDARDERRLIDRLVSIWPRPDRVIEGIHEAREGVWVRHGDTLDEDTIAIGPAWLGRTGDQRHRGCVIGPAWVEDEPASSPELRLPPLSLRDIRDIDPGDAPPVEHLAPNAGLTYAFGKRAVDMTLTALGLMLTAPLMALLALCVYLSDGRPIFYGQWRQTKGGRSFRCWKFRTMYRNADAIKHELVAQNAADGPQFFMENDPRVFRFGRFMRRYHLDELPQLWNVLRGDMSLVGPRPSPDDENQKCPAWREVRLSVKPGITGLWQIRRTREPGLDFQEWIRYDIEYVENAGFLLDARILFSTAFILLSKGLKHAFDKAR